MLGDQRLLLRWPDRRRPPRRRVSAGGAGYGDALTAAADRGGAARTTAPAVPERYDFAGTVGALPMGRHDPCLRIADGAFWWATRTPGRPGHAAPAPRRAASWSPPGTGRARDWVLDQADGGGRAARRPDRLRRAWPRRHPLVAELARRHPGLRLPATGRVFQRLLRAILEQKVTGKEAYRAYAATVRHFHRSTGREPAPGPLPGLLPPPDPAAVAATPYWVFHPFGVEQRRADTLCRAAAVAAALEECADAADGDPAADRDPGHRRVDRGRGGPGRVRRPGRGLGRRLPHPAHGLVGAGRRGPGRLARRGPRRPRRRAQPGRRADARAARAVPRPPRPGLLAARTNRSRRAEVRPPDADPLLRRLLMIAAYRQIVASDAARSVGSRRSCGVLCGRATPALIQAARQARHRLGRTSKPVRFSGCLVELLDVRRRVRCAVRASPTPPCGRPRRAIPRRPPPRGRRGDCAPSHSHVPTVATRRQVSRKYTPCTSPETITRRTDHAPTIRHRCPAGGNGGRYQSMKRQNG